MKTCFHAFCMTQSMFCAIPFPSKIWDEAARPKMLLFLPLIGLEIGLLWWALSLLGAFLKLPPLLLAVVLCAAPYVLTGFLHLDGFLDVTDAVRSCRSMEKRIEILKDPHVGSFAVVGCVLLFLTGFACFASGVGNAAVLVWIPVVSRCCSAIAVTACKPIKVSQYAMQQFQKRQTLCLILQLLLALAAAFLLCGGDAWVLLPEMAGYALALRKGYTSLGGINGDISGYALTISELCALLGAALQTGGVVWF